MHQLPIEQQILLVAEIATLAVLCLRMWIAGLYKVYVYFFGYLVLEFLQALIPVFVPIESRLYLVLYVATQVLVTSFYALVVLELYSKVLRDLPGIASVARRYIKVTVAVAITIALLFLQLGATRASVTGYLLSFERSVMASLVIFVLFVSLFLVYYPVPLGRNVIVYLIGYSVYFLTKAAASLLMNFGGDWIRPLSSMLMAVSLGCCVFWCAALGRQGESKRLVVGHQWNPGGRTEIEGAVERDQR